MSACYCLILKHSSVCVAIISKRTFLTSLQEWLNLPFYKKTSSSIFGMSLAQRLSQLLQLELGRWVFYPPDITCMCIHQRSKWEAAMNDDSRAVDRSSKSTDPCTPWPEMSQQYDPSLATLCTLRKYQLVNITHKVHSSILMCWEFMGNQPWRYLSILAFACELSCRGPCRRNRWCRQLACVK